MLSMLLLQQIFYSGIKTKKTFGSGNCSGRPRVVYNLNKQNLISYQDNFRAKDDILFAIYFDFETTAPTDNCLDPEQKKMFVVSYVQIVAFHPALHLRSYNNPRKFYSFIRTTNNFTLFFSRKNYFYKTAFNKNVKRYGF